MLRAFRVFGVLGLGFLVFWVWGFLVLRAFRVFGASGF